VIVCVHNAVTRFIVLSVVEVGNTRMTRASNAIPVQNRLSYISMYSEYSESTIHTHQDLLSFLIYVH
jgi:hypothetical protein